MNDPKPPFYYTLWSEYGIETSETHRLALRRYIRADAEAYGAWDNYYLENPSDERAKFIIEKRQDD